MKELVYKNILGRTSRKREISIEEIYERPTCRIVKKWICKYFVREQYNSTDIEALKKWVEDKKKNGSLRNCHIMRKVDSRSGTNKVICKIMGDFYIVGRRSAYRIVFVNEVKIHSVVGDKDLTR